MNKSITRASDLILFGALPSDFPKCDLSNAYQIELQILRKCLGIKFEKELRENLKEYDCKPFKSGETYNEGDVVAYNGIFYIALKETQSIPSDIACWEKAPKFCKPCLEELWCNYLGTFLSYAILVIQFPLLVTKFKMGTVVRLNGQGFEASSKADRQEMINFFKNMRDITLENLIAYVKEVNTEGEYAGCFDNIKQCKPCAKKKKRPRGWGIG